MLSPENEREKRHPTKRDHFLKGNGSSFNWFDFQWRAVTFRGRYLKSIPGNFVFPPVVQNSPATIYNSSIHCCFFGLYDTRGCFSEIGRPLFPGFRGLASGCNCSA